MASVIAYHEDTAEAELIQKNKMTLGMPLELLTPGRVGIPFTAEALYSEEHLPIESTPHPYMRFFMKMPFAVKAGDIVRSASE